MIMGSTTSELKKTGAPIKFSDYLNLGGVPEDYSARTASYTDYSATFGREYLWQWYKSWRLAPKQTASVKLSGDSTTVGNNITLPNYTPAGLLPILAKARGFSITTVNAGFSGETTAQWLATRLPADLLAAIPAIYVIRWGMNDPYFGITTAQTIANIRAGMALIRATAGWSSSAVGIVLMMPNTASDDAGGRNELWREKVGRDFRQAALDYGAAFIDTYSLLRTARNQVPVVNGGWLDAPAVHPNDDHSMLIVEALGDMLFPSAMGRVIGAETAVTASASFALPGTSENATSRMEGPRVSMAGYVTGPGTTVAYGTSIATITSNHRPVATTYFLDAYMWDGNNALIASSWENIPVVIQNDGIIRTMVATTRIVNRVYFNKISYIR